MANPSERYDAGAIEVLEGLEPVRKRPAMYIGGTDARGYHHLLWEIVDNSVDEVINGHADHIEVILDEDQCGVTVRDNGRGIPVGRHPVHKKPALELILCTLHAGGKFEGKNYQVSGGLHGVGSSVVNALSESLHAEIKRDGHVHVQSFSRGVPTTKLKKGKATRAHGTSIHFRPDAEIFGKTAKFDAKRVAERLETKSYLHRGCAITFYATPRATAQRFEHPQGLQEYLNTLIGSGGKREVHPEVMYFEGEDPRFELALAWTESHEEAVRSFANGIPTPSGGSHESAVKQGIVKALKAYVGSRKLVPKGVQLTAEDMREGIMALLSVYVREPQFQGQTKDRLNNPEIASPLESKVRSALEQWFHEHGSHAEAIVARVVLAARARAASRAASQQVVRKSAVQRRMNLPGKLADCSSANPEECELFIVEGDSAGGNAKQGRNRVHQAILPLRGKVLNAERAGQAQVLNNRELQDVVKALGCGVGKDFDVRRLRYHRVFLLMDADSDGHHIATLLLTFFYRLLPGLIRGGHVYIAQPPLYRIDAAQEVHWALDDGERDRVLQGLAARAKAEVSRFKGLGEMTANELWETTLDPSRRRALRVRVSGEMETDTVIHELMGKDTSARFRHIMDFADMVQADDLDL